MYGRLLVEHCSAGHKDALAVHETESGQARLLVVGVGDGSLAVALRRSPCGSVQDAAAVGRRTE